MKDSANFAKTRLKMKCIFFYTALRLYIKTEKLIVFFKRINKEEGGKGGVWSRVTKNNFPKSRFTRNKPISRFTENKNDASWQKMDFWKIFITNCKQCSESQKSWRTILNFSQSQGDFQWRFTKNNLVISRFMEIKNGRSHHHEKDLPPFF